MGERVVLITGAGQRLGAATASRLMDEGWYVLVHVRSSLADAQALLEAAKIRNERECGEILQADLTVDADVDGLIQQVLDHPLVRRIGLAGLVHNATVEPRLPV